jgi:DNA-binding transcriptional MerR regulator
LLLKEVAVHIDELAREAGETPRQVRYLISLGVVPPPEGGRRFASYGPAHLAAVRRYQTLREHGYQPAQVTAVLDFERLAAEARATGLPLAPGVTLVVDPAALGEQPADPEAVGRLVTSELSRLLAALPQKESDDAA